MKKALSFLILLTLFSGCSNDDEYTIDPQNPVKGVWIYEWYADAEGIIHKPSEDVKLYLYRKEWVFNEDFIATFKFSMTDENGRTLFYGDPDRGKYRIVENKIIFESDLKFEFKIEKNTLSLKKVDEPEPIPGDGIISSGDIDEGKFIRKK